ncbi:hypothetical protein ACHWQZ_G009629 [Mnemiopsis leidyi]
MSSRMNKPGNKSQTPSPLSLVKGGAARKHLSVRSPVVSPTLYNSPHSKSIKTQDSSITCIDITDSPSGSSLCRSLFDPDKCPCNQSIDSWKIDCSKCHQFWHSNCVTLDGLGKKELNKITNWLCPFCYTAPVSTLDFSNETSCLTCRNTKTLRDANHAFEVAAAAKNIKSAENLSDMSERSDSLLSQENSIKCIESEMKQLNEACQTDIRKLIHEVSQLKSELSNLSSATVQKSPAASASAIDNHDAFLKSISERLDTIMNSQQDFTPAPDLAPPQASTLHEPTIPSLHHNEPHVTELLSNFIDTTTSDHILTFLESQSHAFKTEGGHSVLAFGAPYSYNGSKLLSKSGDTPPTIPEPIKPLIDKLNGLQSDLYYKNHPEHKHQNLPGYVPKINSCLVNRYEGPHSYLPLHSDDEVTIDPESSIFTVSLGESCTVKFIEQNSEETFHVACPPMSLYHMTRKSQDHFRHCIDEGSVTQGIRYSLTFRSVNWTNRNSTCIVGDSNTGLLRFGENSRSSFGTLMPGH